MSDASQDWDDFDVGCMRAAISEAQAALAAGEVPVGAVLTRDGAVVGRGRNRPIESNDASAHAEILALREAGAALGNYRLNDTTLYVTLEPCVMCVGALAQARVRRVVFAAYDEKAGACGSALDLDESAALNHRLEINGGLLADEAAELLRRFFDVRR